MSAAVQVTPDARPTQQPSGLKKLAAKGAFWTFIGYGGTQIFRLVSNLILTRIFAPEIFGLVALINTFMTGVYLFSDIGIRPALIQNKRGDDPDFINTAWTIQVARGAILWVVVIIASIPFAAFYDARLTALLATAGAGALITGFYTTKLITMNRQLNMARLTVIELITQFFTLISMVGIAFVTNSVWAIVIGGLVGNALKLVLAHYGLPGANNRFHWDKEAAAALFKFGRWIFISTALTFIVMQADRLVFGKLVGLASLGVYSIALTIAQLPTQLFAQLADKIAFPVFSSVYQRGEPLAPEFHRIRRHLFLGTGWICAGLAAGGPTIMHLMYTGEFAQGGWIVRVLALSAWFTVNEAVNSGALLAIGQPRWSIYGRIAMILGIVVLIPIGYERWGFKGAVIAYASTEIFRYLVAGFAITRAGLSRWSQDFVFTSVLLASALGGSLALRNLGPLIDIENPHIDGIVDAFIIFVAVTAFWIPLAWPLLKKVAAKVKARA